MLHSSHNRVSLNFRLLSLFAGAMVLLSFTACAKKEQPAPTQTSPQAFASPEDAGNALLQATKTQNQDTLLAIFGSGSKDLIYSGDPVEDKASFEGFARSYDIMHRWRKLSDDDQLLLVGADNQAFPIPLKKNPAGQWYFDTAAGKEEILSQRIGRDENRCH